MAITRNTAWRTIGDTPADTWARVIRNARGPDELASANAWAQTRPHSALALAMLRMESSYATNFRANPASNRNPWNFKHTGPPNVWGGFERMPAANGYTKLASWIRGAAAWRARVTSGSDYKGGVYAKTQTIADLISTFAPPIENETDHYIDTVVGLINDFVDDEVTIPEGDNEMPDVTFGNVPHPEYDKRIVTNSTAWSRLGERTVRGVVWHRMIGTLWGTDGYFRGAASGRALTDYGIGVAATDGGAEAGHILMWNEPEGIRSPWANGSLNAPYGDGLAFYNRYGVEGINRDLASIEISGNYDTPLDAQSRTAIVALTAYWADQYKVRWDEWPKVPGEDRSFVLWHQEFTIGTGKVCPGQVVMGETGQLMAEVKDVLMEYQSLDEVPPDDGYATPAPVGAGTRRINDRLFLGVDESYTLRRAETPRLWADPTSPATGPELPMASVINVTHVVKDIGVDSELTLVLEDGSRLPADAVVGGG